MKKLFALILATGVMVATVAPITASATEVSPVADATVTIPEVAPLPVAELCEAGLLSASAGPCTNLGRRVAVSAAICAASTFGFIKAIRMARAAAAAVRAGEGFLGAFFGGAAILFCWDVYDKFWEWQDCRGGQHYQADVGASANDEELADLLDEVADEMEATGELPDDPDGPENPDGIIRH
ncbi:MAG: hypothetical protein OXM62_05710 [bacterium]|nr:hypothetical protein [bacterium]MDE0234483.1 hypothetical protein [bacterium]